MMEPMSNVALQYFDNEPAAWEANDRIVRRARARSDLAGIPAASSDRRFFHLTLTVEVFETESTSWTLNRLRSKTEIAGAFLEGGRALECYLDLQSLLTLPSSNLSPFSVRVTATLK